ncbi:uncharacterized protein TrAtP1_000221 [Trichoderma atroviride]|uniref:uncharacterized protein n=1 Tax=Hypocrea atroviridis TaxID=63577 RepID=UPI003318DF9D|nr:hypothetical protein TrAtP1_000221 [Trichoderma atroviride]
MPDRRWYLGLAVLILSGLSVSDPLFRDLLHLRNGGNVGGYRGGKEQSTKGLEKQRKGSRGMEHSRDAALTPNKASSG